MSNLLRRLLCLPSSTSQPAPSPSKPLHETETKPRRCPPTPIPEPSLCGLRLTRSFGEGETRTIALEQVSLELFPGDLNLLMGPSGSGKTTLLAVVSGLLRPDQGQVFALGEDLWSLSELALEEFRLRNCSYIFQGCNLFPALTARQHLEMVLRWGEGATTAQARARADEVLSLLGLGRKGHLRPIELSGGEKQRVAIGRALVKRPQFLFADEPTSALDWENGRHVIELLRTAAHDFGTTVLVVTHDHRLIEFADRVFHMADGRIQSDEPAPLVHPPARSGPKRLCLAVD